MAEMQPPYVVVGHSIGGVYAQLYARLRPKDVAGVVLVESAYPNQDDIIFHNSLPPNIVPINMIENTCDKSLPHHTLHPTTLHQIE